MLGGWFCCDSVYLLFFEIVAGCVCRMIACCGLFLFCLNVLFGGCVMVLGIVTYYALLF